MTKAVDFYFDFGSPASYLAWTQLPAICQSAGAQLNYKPMLLGGVFQATGNQSPVAIPAKGKYTFKDFARYALRYGVQLNRNPHFPINTLMLMRAATGLQMRDAARFDGYCAAVYNAIWIASENLNDMATVGGVLAKVGFDPATLVALASDQAVKDQLKANTEAAVARGIFGAPTMFVGDDMFWGQDRLDWVREALSG